ncbi:exodeoxyribonuclease VII small subunit [Terriglobus aquaticus]|uniref:Exodeoxyribonuclease 7 small subunit n=1 Tax=Terriglobus aquaticus TaxID=940139 RepID=A0ABW9KKV8_9BACT|nr:exodeoxyribonuclease VII small subunit [Terriglobus aquaticus]
MPNTFEDNLKQLEAIVERLERGELGLEESLQLFEQGTHLSQQCKADLDAAEGRVQVLLQRGRERVAEDLDLNSPPTA